MLSLVGKGAIRTLTAWQRGQAALRTTFLKGVQRFTVCKAVSLPPEKLILSLKTHKMHEFPARNIEIIVPPGHPISKPVIPRGPKSGGAQAPST